MSGLFALHFCPTVFILSMIFDPNPVLSLDLNPTVVPLRGLGWPRTPCRVLERLFLAQPYCERSKLLGRSTTRARSRHCGAVCASGYAHGLRLVRATEQPAKKVPMGCSRMPMWSRLNWVLTPLYKAIRRHGIGGLESPDGLAWDASLGGCLGQGRLKILGSTWRAGWRRHVNPS